MSGQALLYLDSFDHPVDVGPLVSLRDAPRRVTPASRPGARLASGTYRLRWQTELGDGPPIRLLVAPDRAVVETGTAWEVFGLDGRSRARGVHEHDALTLDAAHGVFFTSHPSGMYSARALADGQLAFAFATGNAAGFHRRVLARRGGRVLVLAIEEPVMSATVRRPELSALEWADLGDPMTVDSLGAVSSQKQARTLLVRAVPVLAGLARNELVLALRDRIFVLDADSFRVTRQLGGDFEPLTLAVDDDGLRLIVRSAGRLAYWHVLPSGERIVSAALPPDLARPELAPIAADTGDVHVLAGDRVVTIGPDGRTRWEASLGAPIAGATALSGGALLVAAGPDVSALDARGDRRLVHHLADARLATAVLPAPGGDLLVASERRLLCLSPP